VNLSRWSGKKSLALAAVLVVLAAAGILVVRSLQTRISNNRPEATSPATGQTRLSLAEASQLLLFWYQQQKPDLNPQVTVPVKEMTTAEIWNRMGVQVFQVSGDIFMYDTFLVTGSQVTPLGIGFGGMGVTSLAVTDLDRNGQPELLYAYSFGSGIHQSRLGTYAPTLPGRGILEAGASFLNGDLKLVKVDDYQVEVRGELFGAGSIRIGVAALQGKGDAKTLVLVLDQGLPPNILDNLKTQK
jgi:hypothetical protein